MVSSIPLEACLCDLRSLTVSSELLGCPIGIHLCLSTFPTSYTKKKGKRYLKRMLATPSEYVTCSFACPVSFSASVQPGFALFNCFSSSCLSLSLAPSLKPFLLALILFTIHLEYRWITNTHLELGFLSTSEISLYYLRSDE